MSNDEKVQLRCERCDAIIERNRGSAAICDRCYEEAGSCCGEWLETSDSEKGAIHSETPESKSGD